MMRMLVSVRSVDEAMLAAAGGADFIDLKEPRDGALGGLAIPLIRDIVAALREQAATLPVSATIGDVGMDQLAHILHCVDAVGACGVDYVKVGIEASTQAAGVLDALAACAWPVVPVFIADQGLDAGLVAHACTLGFPGVMVDTADKQAGSLFDLVTVDRLRGFMQAVREAGAMVGLAGALRLAHVPLLRALAPDFAGFRSAVCDGDRRAALSAARLRELSALLRAPAPAAAPLAG